MSILATMRKPLVKSPLAFRRDALRPIKSHEKSNLSFSHMMRFDYVI